MVSRLDWIVESLFLERPSDIDTSSTYFQVLTSGEENAQIVNHD